MPQPESPRSRLPSARQNRTPRAVPTTSTESLQAFCGFAAAMAELARQSQGRRSSDH